MSRSAAVDKAIGIVLIAVGVTALVFKLSIAAILSRVDNVESLVRLWPLGLVVAGIVLFVTDVARRTGARAGRSR